MKLIKNKTTISGRIYKFYGKIKNSLYLFFTNLRGFKEPIFPELIPPKDLNYNSHKNYILKKHYQSKFSRHYLYIISKIIKKSLSKDIRDGKVTPRILDIGCGFGPLAIATKFMMDSSSCLRENNLKTDEIKYVGIDIRKDAIDWLKKSYKNEKYFHFHFHESNKIVDYVGEDTNSKTNSYSDGNECDYSLNFPFKADIQWSGSFFTHLTPQGAISALNFIRKSLDDGGIAVNTWLIVDAQSCIAMNCKEADRYLEHDMGDYLTESLDNPLICTAFKQQFIEKAYEEAGLEIVEIHLGSWRGFGNKNEFNHYQDVIIATPKS